MKITVSTTPFNASTLTHEDKEIIPALHETMLRIHAAQLHDVTVIDAYTVTARTNTHTIRIKYDMPTLDTANPPPRSISLATALQATREDVTSTPKKEEPEEEPNPFAEYKPNLWDKHRIKTLRQSLRGFKRHGKSHSHMSQSEFAQRLGVTAKCIADWENGRYQPVERYQVRLQKLAELVDKRSKKRNS